MSREAGSREEGGRVTRRLERSVVEMQRKWEVRERKELKEGDELDKERAEKRKKRDEMRELCEAEKGMIELYDSYMLNVKC